MLQVFNLLYSTDMVGHSRRVSGYPHGMPKFVGLQSLSRTRKYLGKRGMPLFVSSR